MSSARALYAYTDDPNNQHMLRFEAGDVITVTEQREDGWWGGMFNGQEGFFPASYVELMDGGETGETSEGFRTDGALMHTSEPYTSRGSGSTGSSLAAVAIAKGSNERRTSDGTFFHSPMTPMEDETTGTTELPTPRTSPPVPSRYTDDGPASAVPQHSYRSSGNEVTRADDDENIPYYKRKFMTEKRKRCKCLWGGINMTAAQFYCMLCTICMLSTLIIILIVVYAIVPSVVKSIVAKSVVRFDRNIITNPQDNGMTIEAHGMITNTGPFKAIIGGMTIEVSERRADGSTWLLGSMPLDQQTVQGDTAINANAQFTILNHENFYTFANHMIFNDTVSWHLEAKTTITPVMGGIKLPGIPNIPFSKDLTLNAAAGLKGVNLTKFDLTQSTRDQIVVNIVTDIPNPSAFSIIPMGDLTFDLYYQGAYLGNVTSYNASLYFPDVRPNLLSMTGVLNPSADGLVAVGSMVNKYLTGQTAVAQARAGPRASTVVAFARGMEGLTLETSVPPLTTALIQKMEFTRMELNPNKTTPTINLGISINLEIFSPLGDNSPMTISSMSMVSDMKFVSDAGDMLTVGTLTIDSTPVRSRCLADVIVCKLLAVNVTTTLVIAGDGTAYGQFVKQFLNGDTINVYVVGKTNVNATYALGSLLINGIDVNSPAVLKGMQNPQPAVQSLQIQGDWVAPAGWSSAALHEVHTMYHEAHASHTKSRAFHGMATTSTNGVKVMISAQIKNPSLTVVKLATSPMNIIYSSPTLGTIAKLGTVWPIDPKTQQQTGLTLQMGVNNLTFMGFLLPNDTKSAGEFFSGYLNGKNYTTSLAFPATGNSGMAQTLSAMNLKTVVPGIPGVALLQNINVAQFGVVVTSATTQSGKGAVTAQFTLPSSVNMNIDIINTTMEVAMSYCSSGMKLPMANMTIIAPVIKNGNALNINFDPTWMRVATSQAAAFSRFANELMNSNGATVCMDGTASAHTTSAMGALELPGVPFTANITLNGLQGFRGQMSISNVDIVGATTTSLKLSLTVTLTNPSNGMVTIAIPDPAASTVKFDMMYTGAGYKTCDVNGQNCVTMPTFQPAVNSVGTTTNIGRVTMTGFKLDAGMNVFQKVNAVYQLPAGASALDKQNGREFLSMFVDQNPFIKVNVSGRLSDGTPGTIVEFLKEAFNAFNLQTNVPGITADQSLITRYYLNTGSALGSIFNIFSQVKTVKSKIQMQNQFSQDIQILQTNLNIYNGDPNPAATPVGNLNKQFVATDTNDRLSCAAHSTSTSNEQTVTILDLGAGTNTLLSSLFGTGRLSVFGTVTAQIGAVTWASVANTDSFANTNVGTSLTGTVAAAQTAAAQSGYPGFAYCSGTAYFRAQSSAQLLTPSNQNNNPSCTLYVSQPAGYFTQQLDFVSHEVPSSTY